MATYKTPDVYVEEIPLFPPSVAEVGTAIPAFIGYTEKATKTDEGDLQLVPTKIRSLAEYEHYFGGPHDQKIEIKVTKNEDTGTYSVTSFDLTDAPDTEPKLTFLLYYAVKMYYDNGGGECYIVSAGSYEDKKVDAAKLEEGLAKVALEDEPTLLVIPEAVKVEDKKYGELMQLALQQCGKLKDRFVIADVYHGAETGEESDSREYFGMNDLKYGAAYYPFLKTTINYLVKVDEEAHTSNVTVTVDEEEKGTDLATYNDPDNKDIDTGLYNFVNEALTRYYITLPASGALAGVYAATDGKRGVWKAPANVSLIGVIEPVIKIDNAMQDDLNVDATTGKSINALRTFAGKGTMVWGGRTLAGNDNEWRYISVRRFFNMVEESVKKSTYWAVFEPNDANTWVKVRGMIESYLTDKWREGALAGATPKDAFYVKCGLGVTMSPQDILEGRMNVEIGMAVVRPAEFIVLKFSHKMQTS